MRKIQLIIFFIVIVAFIAIFWFTQKDSLTRNDNNVAFPTISLPMTENITPLQRTSPTVTPEVQGPIKEDTRASISAVIKTSKGDIKIILFNDQAKFAVKNFLDKAASNYWNNLIFHRVEDWVIQGGDPAGNGTGGASHVTELTGIPFETGSIGWAAGSNMQISVEQRARVSNDSQFFITKSPASWLDTTYTNFGKVVSGMSVVNNIKPGDKILSITID